LLFKRRFQLANGPALSSVFDLNRDFDSRFQRPLHR